MTDDNEVKARQTAHGLIQGYIGPDHKVNRYEGVLLGAGTGSERGAPYVYIAVKIARFGPSLDVGSWHLADLNAEPEDVRLTGGKQTSQICLLMAANDGGFRWSSQHFNLLAEMECWDGLSSSSDLFHGEAEDGDLGSLAAWGVDELDRATV